MSVNATDVGLTLTRESNETQRAVECLNIRFPVSTLLCVGYNIYKIYPKKESKEEDCSLVYDRIDIDTY